MGWLASEFEVISITPADSPLSQTGTVQFTLPGFDCLADLTIERDPAFTPTDEETVLAASTGVPVYRLSTEYTMDSDTLEADFVAWIPEEAVTPTTLPVASRYLGLENYYCLLYTSPSPRD